MNKYWLGIFFVSCLNASTLLDWLEPNTPYLFEFKSNDHKFLGRAVVRGQQQWWELNDEQQYVVWLEPKKVYLLDKTEHQAQEWGYDDLRIQFPELFSFYDLLNEPIVLKDEHFVVYDVNNCSARIAKENDHLIISGLKDDFEVILKKSSEALPTDVFSLPNNYELLKMDEDTDARY